MGWGRCHEPCPSAIPNTEHPRPIHWPPSLDPMLPQQWYNPDYCYLESASRVRPEQSHEMAVSTNHNWGGHVIWLTSHLSDVENYRGFQGYSPFHLQSKKKHVLLEQQSTFQCFLLMQNYYTRKIENSSHITINWSNWICKRSQILNVNSLMVLLTYFCRGLSRSWNSYKWFQDKG